MKTPHFHLGMCKVSNSNQEPKHTELKICLAMDHLCHMSYTNLASSSTWVAQLVKPLDS